MGILCVKKSKSAMETTVSHTLAKWLDEEEMRE